MASRTFQLGDLLYHVHRITVIGNNTFRYPWYLNDEPPEDIDALVDREKFGKFTRVNKILIYGRNLIN